MGDPLNSSSAPPSGVGPRATDSVTPPSHTHVLFPAIIDPEDPEIKWNLEFDTALQHHGQTTVHNLLSDSKVLSPHAIASTYTHVCFLLAGPYVPYASTFVRFVTGILPEAKNLNPSLRILNSPAVVSWNTSKTYLQEVGAAGLPVPHTVYLSPSQPLQYLEFALTTHASGGPVVIKPAIGASGIGCHLIHDPNNLTSQDKQFLTSLLRQSDASSRPKSGSGNTAGTLKDSGIGSIMLQDFEPGIKNGEYSFVIVQGRLLWTILKVPPDGDWRAHPEKGATATVLDEKDVPSQASTVVKDVLDWLSRKFEGEQVGYVRIDGVMRSNGEFMLMEIELIEPELIPPNRPDLRPIACEAICNALLDT